MNEAFQQLVALILQGVAWLVETATALWTWSWTQIASVLNMNWTEMPSWKIAIGMIAVALFAGILVALVVRGWHAIGRIAQAFWTMTLTVVSIVAFVVAAGLFSRGFQWVVASVPDDFWQEYL